MNVGKWVLWNLFAPFVAQEQMMQAPPPQSSHAGIVSPPGLYSGRPGTGISRQGGPGHISLEDRRAKSISDISAVQRTPGLVAAMATAPATPALVPDLPADALKKITAITTPGELRRVKSTDIKVHPMASGELGLQTIPQSPSPTPAPSVGHTPRPPTRSHTLDNAPATSNSDYFSIRKEPIHAPEDGTDISGNALESKETLTGLGNGSGHTSSSSLTQGGPPPGSLAPNPSPVVPLSPGQISSIPSAVAPLKFIGKLKAFGKPKKTGTETAETPATPAPQATTQEEEKVRFIQKLSFLSNN